LPPANIHRSFAFDPDKSAPIAAAWNKYTTLIEIVSLSTSPNQLRDAASDLKRLLDPASYIPASWIVALVTLGFQAGSGGVCRAFWDIVTSLEKKRLARLFEGPEGRKLLQDVLLPYAAHASNFVISRSTPEKCAHGEQLAKWVGNVLSAGCLEAKKATARAVLEWVDEKEDNLFAPARAWILQGVLKGVQGERAFTEARDLELLVKIAKMRRL
jgi:tRNA guanosine-2'-O-methyltransferase